MGSAQYGVGPGGVPLAGINAPTRLGLAPATAAKPPPVAARPPAYVGGTAAGATGVAGTFGLNTNLPPAHSGAGYLGSEIPTPPNPWANNLLPGGGIPVSQQNPAYNLFTNHAPNSVTPANSGGAAPGAMQHAPVAPSPGPAVRPGSSPLAAATPSATPVAPPPGAMPPPQQQPPPNPYGMPPWMQQQMPRGPQGQPIGFGGGAVPHPSPLLAASNPASGMPQAMAPSGAPAAAPQMPPPQMSPQQMQQMQMQMWNSPPPGFAGGGSSADLLVPNTTAGTDSAPLPNSTYGPSATSMIGQLLTGQGGGGAPPAGHTPTSEEEMMNMLARPYSSGHSGGGGDNSVQALMAHLHLQPGVMHSGGGYAGGGPLAMATAGHVMGDTGGQDDKVNARLSDGEYVMDADTVSSLGDGNNAAGAKSLDQLREAVRTQKRSAPADKIPPKAKPAVTYLPKKKTKTAASASADAALQTRK